MRYLRTNSGHTRIRSPTRRAHIAIHSPHRTVASVAAFPADPRETLSTFPHSGRGSARKFGSISLNLTGDYAREPFFIGLEECCALSSKSILAVRCH
jgi:hypothetical protein